MPLAVLAALGNPGAEYAATRHNAGWLVIEALAEQAQATWRTESRFPALVAKIELRGTPIHLVKPLVFMNETGQPLAAFLRFHRIEPSDCVVLHDDIAFPPGALRLTSGGSDGGHNGITSCIQHLGPTFIRARIGILVAGRANDCNIGVAGGLEWHVIPHHKREIHRVGQAQISCDVIECLAG
jgi:PTH1 family peptidyl-tRNA hydrolase